MDQNGSTDEEAQKEVTHTSNTKQNGEAYIGRGKHAIVRTRYLDGKRVVTKQWQGVRSESIAVRNCLGEDLKNLFDRIWRDLDHANICTIYQIEENPGCSLSLVTDLFQNGSIIKFIQRKLPSIPQRMKWANEIAEGLAHLHISTHHGDLRCANVFLDNYNRAVLTDYGIAHHLDNSDLFSAKSTLTVRWTSPEVISPRSNCTHNFSQLDIFALGMTILEVFSGNQPFGDKSDADARLAIVRNESPKLPDNMANNLELKSIFYLCTYEDPNERPSAHEVATRIQDLISERTDLSLFALAYRVFLFGIPMFYSVRIDSLESGAIQWDKFVDRLQKELTMFITISVMLIGGGIAILLAPNAIDPVLPYFVFGSILLSLFTIILSILSYCTFSNMQSITFDKAHSRTSTLFSIDIYLALPAVWQIWSILPCIVYLVIWSWNYDAVPPKQNSAPKSWLSLRSILITISVVGLIYILVMLFPIFS